jgi:hypothetical protein
MPTCDAQIHEIDPDFTMIGECPNQGWPELDGLCMDHYREFVVSPVASRLAAVERLYMELSNELFKVEVASGLRAAPISQRGISVDDKTETKPKTRVTKPTEEVEDFI